MFSGWKGFFLRLFGAKIDSTAIVYSSANVYYPANLTMGRFACMADGVECYNADSVIVEDQTRIDARVFAGMGAPLDKRLLSGFVLQYSRMWKLGL